MELKLTIRCLETLFTVIPRRPFSSYAFMCLLLTSGYTDGVELYPGAQGTDLSRFKRTVTNYVDTNNTSDVESIVPKDLRKTVYQYVGFKHKFPKLTPTICFTKNGFNDSGQVYYNFTCPMLDQDKEFSKCCGPEDVQYCCKNKSGVKASDVDIITAVSISASFFVSMSLCLVLYCCCCQRRGELHSGKLIWIKKKKNKTIYEEGGVSPRGSVVDPDEDDVELVGFIPVPENHQESQSPFGSRKSIDAAISEANRQSKLREKEHGRHKDKHHHHKDRHHHRRDHHGDSPHHHGNTKSETKASISKNESTPEHKLNIPLINIQPSTPEPPMDDCKADNDDNVPVKGNA